MGKTAEIVELNFESASTNKAKMDHRNGGVVAFAFIADIEALTEII